MPCCIPALVALLGLLAGCRTQAPPSGSSPAPRSPAAAIAPLTDDLGQPWKGPLPARRSISLAPNVTEIVCAIGGRDRLVGIDAASDFPPDVKKIPSVGDFLRPSAERIISLQPDVVLLSSGTVTADAVAEFRRACRAPVFVLNPRRLPDVARNVRDIGRLLGLDAKAGAVAVDMERRFSAVKAAVAGRPRPRVFLEVWHEPLTTVGPGTFLDDLIRLAGGVNVAASQEREYPTLSLEGLIGADPEVYIVTVMQKGLMGPDPAKRPEYRSLRAVRTGRVYRVPADPVLRPTPRLAEGAERLARAIHPEAHR